MTEPVTREFVERGKDMYEKVQAAAEESTKAMERTYSTATKGVADFNSHLLEIAQENMNAAFDWARQLTRAKSPTEFFELSAAYMHKRFEAFTEQAQRLTTDAQRAATDAAQPLQSELAKTFKKSA